MLVAHRTIFFLLFTLSGFSGLIYESIWTHYLKLFLGHAAYAQTLVLAIFMSGLALGSWICSKYSVRWKNLLVGYALTEGVVGLCALVFHNVFDQMIQSSYVSVIPYIGSPLGIAVYKWTLSALMILPQTILLGMTFPLMAAAMIRMFPTDSGRSISMLYFCNSLGAAIGVLASGFILIRLVGLPGTIRVAGLMNVALGVYVWLLAKGLPTDSLGSEVVKDKAKGIHGKWYWFLLIASLVTGTASFIYEIGWIRMLSLVLGSSTHAFELMLSAFIFGLAFGGLWIRYRIERITDTIRFLFIVQIIMGVLALSTLLLYGNTFLVMQWLLKTLHKTDNGYTLFNLSSIVIALAIMLPTTFCAGTTLPLITYSMLKKGQGEGSIGAVYAANTIGAIIGVFFAIHIGMPFLGLKGLITAGAGLDIVLGLALLWSTRAAYKSLRVPALIAATGVVLLVLTWLFVELDYYKMASGVYRSGTLYPAQNARLVFHKDGKTATVSSLLIGGVLDIRTNGKADASIQLDSDKPAVRDESTMILLATIPMSLNPEAKTVANIGFGSGLTTATLLLNDKLHEVDTIEMEPAMIEAAKNFGSFVELAYRDPRSKIHVDDAKTFFSAHNKKYDIIISEPSNPWVSGVASLFSEEFYRVISRHLTENGLFCQWLQVYEIDQNLVISVVKALSSAFEDFVIYATTDTNIIIIAKNGKTIADPDYNFLLSNPRFDNPLRRIQIASIQDLALRKIASKKTLDGFIGTFPIRPNSDYYPVLDQNAARTRFLQANAADLLLFINEPFPVTEMLTKAPLSWRDTHVRPSPAFIPSHRAFVATVLRDYYLKGNFEYPIPEDVQRQAVFLKKLFFNDCSAGSKKRISSLYNIVALRMNPFLRPHEINAVWGVLESGACARSFTARDREWIMLYKAVGQRDANTMANTAQALLEKERDLPQGPTGYLLATGMLGYLSQGDRAQAFHLWQNYQSRIFGTNQQPMLLFRLLVPLSVSR